MKQDKDSPIQVAIDHFKSVDQHQKEQAVIKFLTKNKRVTDPTAKKLLENMLEFIQKEESFEFFKWYKATYLKQDKG
jgi:hypothetical protein